MATLDDIKILLESIRDEIPSIIRNTRVGANQIVVVSGLSEMSEQLGLIQAGEFRTGNAKEPGFGFTGGRFGWPGFEYSGDTYFLAGVENDILQVGLSLIDGKIYAGSGAIVIDVLGINAFTPDGLQKVLLDENGITMEGDSTTLVRWLNTSDQIIGDIFSTVTETYSGIAIEAVGNGSLVGYVGLIAYTGASRANWNSLSIFENTGAEFAFKNAVNKNVGRALVVNDERNSNVFAPLLYLDMYKTTAGGVGLGPSISFRGWNASSALTDMAYTGARYLTATGGSEDVEIPFAVMVNGTMHEMLAIGPGGLGMADWQGGIRTASVVVAADTATDFAPARLNGMIVIGCAATGNGGIAQYNVSGPSCGLIVGGANFAVATGALTGTTGGVGKLTVSAHATNGHIYIENRTGAQRTIYYLLI